MELVLAILGIFYTLLIAAFIIGFNRLPLAPIASATPEVCFSIIIPFRNEIDTLPKLMKSLDELAYPSDSYEIFLVNDASTDASVSYIQEFITTAELQNVFLIENNRRSISPKKDAITTAIYLSKFEWILTTDADCTVPSVWLQAYNDRIRQTDALLVAGPIALSRSTKTSLLNAYESLDVHSLLGATIGAFGIGIPFMANGANLAYKKDTFLALNGFTGNDHLASGDDIFMLEKVRQLFKNKVVYLKNREALVTTSTQVRWGDLLSQRIRWAAKSTGYTSRFPKVLGILVLLINLASILCVLGIMSALGGYAFAKAYHASFLFFLVCKLCVDGVLIWKTLLFTERTSVFMHYVWVALIYPFVSVYVAMRALTGNYVWKGRQFKR